MSNADAQSRFHTGFGILHSLTLIERESRSLLSEAIHRNDAVSSGLESGQMPSDRAVVLLRATLADLQKLTN